MSILLSTLVCFAPGDGGSGAEDPFRDLPTYDLVTPEEIKRDFVRLEFEPLGRPELAFYFLSPREWVSEPITLTPTHLQNDDKVPVPVALVRSPDKTATVEVAYLRVPKGTVLEDWARGYIRTNGLELELFQTGKFTGRTVFDALVRAPGQYRVRLTFFLRGPRMFVMAGSAPDALYPTYAKILASATVSFAFAQPEG